MRARLVVAVLVSLWGVGCGGSPGGGGAGEPVEPETPEVPVAPVVPINPFEELVCDPATERVGEARVWRLTRAQLDAAASVLAGTSLGFGDALEQDPLGPYGFSNVSNTLRITELDALGVQQSARKLASQLIATRLPQLFPCMPDQLADAACAGQFVASFGERAFRRPLTMGEQERYLALYMLAQDKLGGDQGVRITVEAMLQAPGFLYREELGGAPQAGESRVRLSPHEIASALAFTLWGEPPDGVLLGLASDGALDTDEGVAQVAGEMVRDPRAARGAAQLYGQWFGLSELPTAVRSAALFPEYEALRPEMIAQAERFITHIMLERDGSFEALMTSRTVFVNAATAPLVGAEGVEGAAFEAREVEGRAGILTMPAVLSNFSSTEDASIAKRGLVVLERLLCDHVPDPPPGVFDTLPAVLPDETQRAYFERTTEADGCQGCHAKINAAGYALDGFDALGRVRLQADGTPWKTTSQLAHTRDIDGPIAGATELAAQLVRSGQVRQCVATQHMRYALGRDVTQADACSIKAALDTFDASGGDLRALLVATVSSTAFLYRQPPTTER